MTDLDGPRSRKYDQRIVFPAGLEATVDETQTTSKEAKKKKCIRTLEPVDVGVGYAHGGVGALTSHTQTKEI
jgi:hypothetical protein